MNDCISQSELELYQSGELPETDEARVRSHLESCAACAEASSRTANRFDDLIQHIKGLDLSGAELDALHAGRRSKRPRISESMQSGSGGNIPLPPPDSFPGYEVTREIHHGGQGIVYQAIQHSTRRKVAIKVLLDGAYASRSARRRFEREIDLIAGLKHPDIVSIFDSGVTADGRQFYVMDFVAGQRLEQFVRDHRLSIDDVLRLFIRIADAVNYAHQRGVIHRDLKPWNIVVDAEGNPKILDFGLAKTVVDKVDPLLSVSGQVVGTLPYMSPEQTRGKSEEIDIRTDVYALGVILYEVLTGQYPYPVVGEMADVLQNISHTAPKPLSRAWDPQKGISFGGVPAARSRKGCPIDDEIETIVLKSLSKERERRYQSAGELARDIRHYLAGEPIDAKRDSGWYVIRKAMRKHKFALGAAALIVLLITGSAISLMFMYNNVRQLWEHSENQTRLAEHERDRALRAESLANQRFNDVRQLANAFIFDFHDKIADLAGSVPARELLVTKALQYLENLRESAGNDPELLREISNAYKKVGDVQGGAGLANLGDTAGALESYRRGLALIDEVLNITGGTDANDLRNWGVLSDCVGDVLAFQGDPDGALRQYDLSRNHFDALLKANPDGARELHDLATSYSRIGQIYIGRRDYSAALPIVEKSRDFCRMASERAPTNSRFKFDLTVALQKIAEIQTGLRMFDEALASYQQVNDLSRDILSEDPDSARAKRGMGIGYDGIAKLYYIKGDNDKAAENFAASLKIGEELAAADPMNAQAQRDLYTDYGAIGVFYSAIDRREDALKLFEKGIKIAETLNESDPASALTWLDLAVILGNYGGTLIDMGRAEDGLEALLRGERALAELHRRDPTNPQVQRNTAISHQSIGYAHAAYAQQKDLAASERKTHLKLAVEFFEKSLTEFAKLRDDGYLSDDEMYVFDENKSAISEAQKSLETGAAPLSDTTSEATP